MLRKSITSAAIELALIPVVITFMPKAAVAHEAPSGWKYPYSCCSTVDCRPVNQTSIRERPEGYVIQSSGEVVAYQDTRVKDSPDGDFHWCSVEGADNSKTICLFVPPRAF